MTKKKPTTRDCAGCRDDFYNGRNDLGVKQCWSLESAEFTKARDIPVDLRPPYTGIPLTTRPSCWRGNRVVRVKPEALTADGFWR